MTESEAINFLKNNEERNPASRYIRVKQLSISALEKQIAKKPEHEADEEWVYDYAKCPICGHDFEYGINDWGCEYCSDCGQKLDWSDEE